jgi:hypothetical protein
MDAVYERAKVRPPTDAERAEGESRIDMCLVGWILPTLAVTCSPEQSLAVLDRLEKWIALAGRLYLGVESCLAQGFKFEANRLPERVEGHREARDRLIELCRLCLGMDYARWWYSRISLLQALALWAQGRDREERRELMAIVQPWTADGVHPFLAEAARLSMRAIDRQDAARHVWIDEAGTAAKIGPRAKSAESGSSSGLWIPQAVGWHSLDKRAQRLLGDLFLLLNLIERADPAERERRRRESCDHDPVLPACLSTPVEAGRGLFAERPAEGSACADGCVYGLCPYPPKEDRPFRGELSEGFCRRQRSLLSGVRVRRPQWQRTEEVWQLAKRRSHLRYRRELWAALERRGGI